MKNEVVITATEETFVIAAGELTRPEVTALLLRSLNIVIEREYLSREDFLGFCAKVYDNPSPPENVHLFDMRDLSAVDA